MSMPSSLSRLRWAFIIASTFPIILTSSFRSLTNVLIEPLWNPTSSSGDIFGCAGTAGCPGDGATS